MIWSGSEEHQHFGVRLRGVGAEPRLPRSLFCREGRRLPTTSTVISACGGKKGTDRETERELCACLGARTSPAQAQGVASPGGAQSIRRPGEWCEVRCLLCHGKTAAYEGLGARGPQGPQICLRRPSRPTRSSSLSTLAHVQDALTQT